VTKYAVSEIWSGIPNTPLPDGHGSDQQAVFRYLGEILKPCTKSLVLSLKQAEAYLQVSKAHLSNVIDGKVSGMPPVRSFRLGRRVLIKREWIDKWLETTNQEVARQF
jgi:hypothetical protein